MIKTNFVYNLFKILSSFLISVLVSGRNLKKTQTSYTSKQPLMMAYEGSESARDNFGKFMHQCHPETKTLIRKLERI